MAGIQSVTAEIRRGKKKTKKKKKKLQDENIVSASPTQGSHKKQITERGIRNESNTVSAALSLVDI